MRHVRTCMCNKSSNVISRCLHSACKNYPKQEQRTWLKTVKGYSFLLTAHFWSLTLFVTYWCSKKTNNFPKLALRRAEIWWPVSGVFFQEVPSDWVAAYQSRGIIWEPFPGRVTAVTRRPCFFGNFLLPSLISCLGISMQCVFVDPPWVFQYRQDLIEIPSFLFAVCSRLDFWFFLFWSNVLFLGADLLSRDMEDCAT